MITNQQSQYLLPFDSVCIDRNVRWNRIWTFRHERTAAIFDKKKMKMHSGINKNVKSIKFIVSCSDVSGSSSTCTLTGCRGGERSILIIVVFFGNWGVCPRVYGNKITSNAGYCVHLCMHVGKTQRNAEATLYVLHGEHMQTFHICLFSHHWQKPADSCINFLVDTIPMQLMPDIFMHLMMLLVWPGPPNNI